MKYKIIALVEGDSPLELSMQLVLTTDDQKIFENAVTQAQSSTPPKFRAESVPDAPRQGRKGRAVYVKAIDEDDAPSGFYVGLAFPSAKDLSDALGFRKYNAVSMALKKVEHDEKEAALRGITFAYVDDIRD